MLLARRYEVDWGRLTLGYYEAGLLTEGVSAWYLNPYPLVPLEVTQLVLEHLEAEGAGPVNMVMAVDATCHGLVLYSKP